MSDQVDLTKPSAAALRVAVEDVLGPFDLECVPRDARSVTVVQKALGVHRRLPGLTTVFETDSRVCTVRNGGHPQNVLRQRLKRNEWNLKIANARYREAQGRLQAREDDERAQVLKDPAILRAWRDLTPQERTMAMRMTVAMGMRDALRGDD